MNRRIKSRFSFLLVAAVLLGAGQIPACAGVGEFISNVWQRFCAPNPRLDADYVFQPRKGWGAAAGYELRSNSISLNPQVQYSGEMAPASISTRLSVGPRLSHLASVYATYGPITLGLSQEVGSSFKQGRFNFLSFFSDSYELDIRYSSYSAVPECSSHLYNIGVVTPVDISSLAKVQSLAVNAAYAFSPRFTYQAVYGGRSVQRLSHGSWLVAAKFTNGKIVLDPNDVELMWILKGYGRFVTNQLSLGGGYSFNWVLFHRDAQSPRDLRSLQNLTFNVTAIPMLTLYNGVVYQQYKSQNIFWIDTPSYLDEIVSTYRAAGRLLPNFTARAGFVYHFGHFYVNAWGDYTRFELRGGDVRVGDIGSAGTFSHSGSFSNWSITLKLNYRF